MFNILFPETMQTKPRTCSWGHNGGRGTMGDVPPILTFEQVVFQKKRGQIVLDQIRTVDKTRLLKKLGKVSPQIAKQVLSVLGEMFAP